MPFSPGELGGGEGKSRLFESDVPGVTTKSPYVKANIDNCCASHDSDMSRLAGASTSSSTGAACATAFESVVESECGSECESVSSDRVRDSECESVSRDSAADAKGLSAPSTRVP